MDMLSPCSLHIIRSIEVDSLSEDLCHFLSLCFFIFTWCKQDTQALGTGPRFTLKHSEGCWYKILLKPQRARQTKLLLRFRLVLMPYGERTQDIQFVRGQYNAGLSAGCQASFKNQIRNHQGFWRWGLRLVSLCVKLYLFYADDAYSRSICAVRRGMMQSSVLLQSISK